MQIVIFTHPSFLTSQSMPRFARMLEEGMRHRGHQVKIWSPKARFYKLPVLAGAKKWLGYIDQYLLFPVEVRRRLKSCPLDTLFVFTDQALGPWVPLVANRPHVIHCHDFLAQRSALGQVAENPTRWTGKRYQAFIRWGYRQGKNFIAVSEKTREDLLQFLSSPPLRVQVIYNGLNQAFAPNDQVRVRALLSDTFGIDLNSGFVMHVGGNQWYKNRKGVIEIYNAWRQTNKFDLPLLMIGWPPDKGLLATYDASPCKTSIHMLSGINDETVRLAYAGASVFLYPSLAEGFGWPIAEAMASACPVITTNEAPMNEVGGEAAFYIAKRPSSANSALWAARAAKMVNKVIDLPPSERKKVVEAGMENAKRFDSEAALNQIESIYFKILQSGKEVYEDIACHR